MKTRCLNPNYFILWLTILILIDHSSLKSQTLINQLWDVELNYPDTIPWNATVLNSSSDLFTTGNTWHNDAQKVNIVTTKTNSSGTVIWQTEYNGTLSGYDYGAAICLDGSGNVYVAGATHNTSSYTFDIVIIKYNSSGSQQWATLFNGSGSGMDIPSGICVDGSGNVYICGASMGSTTGYDYVTIKLNSSGTTQWSHTYDYASLSDLPGYIAWNSGTSKVGVAGASQSSTTNWDYTTIKYNSSGTLTNTNRTSTTGYGFDRPTGLVTDASDNYYITGYAFNGTDYDLRTIKLDDDLSPIWTRTENGGDEDGSNGIAIDGSNNTYICGFSTNGSGKQEMQIIKYNSSGTKQWTKTLSNAVNNRDAQAVALTYNSTNNRVIVTGYYKYASGRKVITTFALDHNSGSVIWKTEYPNLIGSIDIPKWIEENGNHIWVTGTRTVDDTTRYLTIKYETYNQDDSVVIDAPHELKYAASHILISFNPDLVNLDFVNNKQQLYDNLENVIPDTVYDRIIPLLSGGDQFSPKAIKIFKRLTANDSLSITRQDDTIPIPPVWSALIVTTNVDPFDLLDTLSNEKDIIEFVDLDQCFYSETGPTDLQASQENLDNPTNPEEDIKFVNAWEISQGKSFIRAGVVDVGIYWKHEDFGYPSDALRVTDGYDFGAGHNWDDDDNSSAESLSHGTEVAGILGAITDNGTTGISGVAGGNYIEDDPSSYGIQLVDLEVYQDDGLGNRDANIFESIVVPALYEGATYSTTGTGPEHYGFELNILNQSWGALESHYDDPQLLQDAIAYIFRHGVTDVCSKGNWETGELHIPSDYSDVYTISVGGSGDGGIYDGADPIDDGDGSDYGNHMDLIAPYGYSTILETLTNDAPDSYLTSSSTPGYFGTSYSAPQVSGAAALLMSYLNNPDGEPHFENLAPEDVENILQMTATEGSDFPCTNDRPDDYCGYGLLNIEAALLQVEKPHYKLLHFSNYYAHGTVPIDGEDINISFDEWTHLPTGIVVPYGDYVADRYKIDETVYHTLSPSSEIIAYWKLQSMSDVVLGPTYFPATPEIDFELGTPSTSSVHVKGFFYHLKERYVDGTLVDDAVNKWIPSKITAAPLRISYSLLVYDENADEVNNEISADGMYVKIMPNPTSDVVTLSFSSELNQQVIVEIKDIAGNRIFSESFNEYTGENTISLNLNFIPSGIYLVSVLGNAKSISTKLVKL